MRLVKNIFLLALFTLSINLMASEHSLNIVYPHNNSLHRETTLGVVVYINPKQADKLKIVTSVNEKIIKIIKNKVIYCKSIELRLGENTITVRSYKNEKMVDEKRTKIYVASDIHHQYKYPPKIYKRAFFHTTAKESQCKKCHDMSSNEVKGIAFIDVKKSNCYQCHKSILKDKFAHAPAVNWLCGSCHDGKAGKANKMYEGKSKYLAALPVNRACFKCHKDNFRKWSRYRYRHEPLDSGQCNKCHNPHSSPYNMFVRKPVNEICMGCHKDKFIKARKRLKNGCAGGSKESLCIDCHTPHASSKKFFLKEKKVK